MLTDMSIDDVHEGYTTELGEIDGIQTVAILNDQSAYHAFTKHDVFEQQVNKHTTDVFTFEGRYSSDTFQGIMPDTGASGVSSAGEPQFKALRKIDPKVQLGMSRAGEHKIRFGKGDPVASRGTVDVSTPLGTITFHVLPTNTPFLFCIKDMDNMGVELHNLKNVLVQGTKVVPVVRKWGHPWMLLNKLEETVAWSHLTESDLRQLHR
jgi:hypothetical protein